MDICVIPSNFEWNDIGSFNNIARLLKKDKDGNAVFGNYAAIDTKNCIIASEANHLVGTIGIKDLIIIQSSDALLVCDRKRAQDIKRIVKKIKAKDLTRFL